METERITPPGLGWSAVIKLFFPECQGSEVTNRLSVYWPVTKEANQERREFFPAIATINSFCFLQAKNAMEWKHWRSKRRKMPLLPGASTSLEPSSGEPEPSPNYVFIPWSLAQHHTLSSFTTKKCTEWKSKRLHPTSRQGVRPADYLQKLSVWRRVQGREKVSGSSPGEKKIRKWFWKQVQTADVYSVLTTGMKISCDNRKLSETLDTACMLWI